MPSYHVPTSRTIFVIFYENFNATVANLILFWWDIATQPS